MYHSFKYNSGYGKKPWMTYTYEIKNHNTIIIYPEGDLLGNSSEQQLIALVEDKLDANLKNCILDASKISYMNSSGINLVINILTHFQKKGGRLVITSPNDAVMKLLVITKLNRVLNIFEDSKKAMEIFQ